eukprot:1749821-Pleurochrysis_carterae.AAC.1
MSCMINLLFPNSVGLNLFSGVAFWYKPDSSHRNLYPSAKDEDGNPSEATVDGEKIIQPCEHEIEVFKTGHAPDGMPGLATFASDANDKSKMRFDLKEAEQNVAEFIAKAPELFDEAHKKDWAYFFDNFPRTVED